MTSLAFRCPGSVTTLEELLCRALPGASARALDALVRSGAVSVGGRPARRLSQRVAPGRRIGVSGSDAPENLLARLRDRQPEPLPTPLTSCLVLVPARAWRRGSLPRRSGHAVGFCFETQEVRGPVAELFVKCVVECTVAADGCPSGGRALEGTIRDALESLAAADLPVLGDVERGGILVSGGIRIRALADSGSSSPAADVRGPWWPDDPVFASSALESAPPAFRVSRATQRVLAGGHPWILRDAQTDDPEPFAPGALVLLRSPGDEPLGLARIEGGGRLTARMWSPGSQRSRQAESVEARVAAALARRRPLFESATGDASTNAYRLVHGEADGLPGLFIDRLAGLLRVLVTSPATDAYRPRAIEAVVRSLVADIGADPPVVEVLHLRDRPAGELECVRLVRGDPEGVLQGSRLCVREGGVSYWVDPGLAEPARSRPGVGLFLDQRPNRARLAASSRRLPGGGRWLNLFAHTGAFSVALLAAGAREVVSVDLSGAYLGWLRANLAVNSIDPKRHVSLRHDVRRYLERLSEGDRFDGIILDPPTAAAAGRRFWSVAKDLPALVEQALVRLAPGGVLLVSRNDRHRSELGELVRNAARRSGVAVSRLEPAPPGPDFPALQGFPEAEPFAAVIATRA